MKSGLPKLNQDATCVKCGNMVVGMIYRHPLDKNDCKKLGIELQEGQEGMPEHMMRDCKTCNYRWIEQTLDSKEEE